jgi:hypothetical protein
MRLSSPPIAGKRTPNELQVRSRLTAIRLVQLDAGDQFWNRYSKEEPINNRGMFETSSPRRLNADRAQPV